MYAQWLKASLVVSLLASLSVPVGAQDDFFGLEGVEEEEEAPRLSSHIEVGLGWLDDGDRSYGRYTGLTREGLVPHLDIHLEQRPAWDGDDTAYWRVIGRRLGLDSRRLEVELGHQGMQRFRAGYRQSPNHAIGPASTPFEGVGSAFLTLPNDWATSGATTGTMDTLEQHLYPIDVGTMRRRYDLGYQRVLDSAWSFDADFRRETKEGTRAVGAAFGSTGGNPRSAIVPAPVDFVTDIFDVSLRYARERYQLGFSYHGSMFDNRQPTLTWQNPFGQLAAWAPGVGHPDGLGRMALEPANSFHQFRVDGAYRVSDVTRITADMAFGRMAQDEPFLPYTVNPALTVEQGLPRTSLDGRIDTTVINLRINSQPMPRLNTTASWRYDDRDNRTPQAAYRYIAGDSQHQRAEDASRINLPYSYREQRFDLAANYRLQGGLRLSGGYRYRDVSRDFSETSGADEHIYRFGLRAAPADTVLMSLDYRRSERDAGTYDGRAPYIANHMPGTVGPDDFENHPLLRKYYLADRDRDQYAARIDWMPTDRFSLGFAASDAQDRYDNAFFGLNRGRARNVTLDAGYHLGDTVHLSLWHARDRMSASQRARSFQANPATVVDADRDWAAEFDDRVDSAGLGIRVADAGQRMGLSRDLELGADAIWSRARTRIDVSSGPALTTAPLPDLTSRLTGISVFARYHLNKATSWRLGVERERFQSVDFALDDVAPDTMGNVLALSYPSPDYGVTWVTARIRYRF